MKQEESYTESEEENEEKSFFFDSYAFFEIIRENRNYLPYLSTGIITIKLNLFELYHGFLKEKNEELAKILLEKYYPFAIDFDKEVIQKAAQLKLRLNRRDLSMADCIGYELANQLGIKFLTGDKEFENLDNVEFVK